MRYLLTLLLLLAPHTTHALATLAADVNLGVTERYGGEPAELTRMGNLSYFRACDRTHGCELWQTDGTSAGTVMVADICPGPCSSSPTGLYAAFDATLYFAADDGAHGLEPWAYRPDLGTPRMVMDANPGAVGSSPQGFIATSHGHLAGVYFMASMGSSVNGANSIVRVQESTSAFNVYVVIPPGTLTNIGVPVTLGDQLFFRATMPAGGAGSELHVLLAAGGDAYVLSPLRDVFPGSTGASVDMITPHPALGVVFFRAANSNGNVELWKSDGSYAGTRQVKEIRAGGEGSYPADLVVMGNKLYFTANDGATGINDRELWSSDGTEAGTVRVKDIRAGTVGSDPVQLRVRDNRVLFVANDGIHGKELWISNGTEAGTTLVTDLIPGADGLAPYDYQYNDAVVTDGFYYIATDTTLYRTDGSAAGTRRVGSQINDAIIGMNDLHHAGDRVLFTVGTLSEGRELFGTRIDAPTQHGIVRVIGDQIGHSMPRSFHALSGGDIVVAYDDVDGYEWRRLMPDGTADLLVSLSSGANAHLPMNLPAVPTTDGRLWFVGNYNELWLTDGSIAGTRMVFDFTTLPVPEGNIACATGYGDEVVLLMRSYSPERMSLWKSDGTAEGTVPLLQPENIAFGTILADRYCPFVAGDTILLAAAREGTGAELFRSNGTPGNLTLVRDIVPGQSSSYVTWPTRVGNVAYFVASDESGDANSEVWRTDGTAQGTQRVREIHPSGSANPHALAAFGDGVLFIADDGSSGYELYRSNGTAAGTTRVADLHPGAGSAFVRYSSEETSLIAVDGNQALFAATVSVDGVTGSHLFVTDGTEAGTRRIVAGDAAAPLSPQGAVALRDGGVVFAGYAPDTGRELWFSDGTDAGTLAVSDIVPGAASGGPEHIAASADGALFAADDGVRGREPWRVVLTRGDGLFADGFE